MAASLPLLSVGTGGPGKSFISDIHIFCPTNYVLANSFSACLCKLGELTQIVFFSYRVKEFKQMECQLLVAHILCNVYGVSVANFGFSSMDRYNSYRFFYLMCPLMGFLSQNHNRNGGEIPHQTFVTSTGDHIERFPLTSYSVGTHKAVGFLSLSALVTVLTGQIKRVDLPSKDMESYISLTEVLTLLTSQRQSQGVQKCKHNFLWCCNSWYSNLEQQWQCIRVYVNRILM